MPEVPPTDVTNRMTTVILNGPIGLWEGHENCSLVDGKKKGGGNISRNEVGHHIRVLG